MGIETDDWSDDIDDGEELLEDVQFFDDEDGIDGFTDEARPMRAMTAKQRLEEIMEEKQLRSNIANWDDWDTLLANS